MFPGRGCGTSGGPNGRIVWPLAALLEFITVTRRSDDIELRRLVVKVAFIGLGRMGQAMARRLLEADHDLVVYNRTPEKLAGIASLGVGVHKSIGEETGRASCRERWGKYV